MKSNRCQCLFTSPKSDPPGQHGDKRQCLPRVRGRLPPPPGTLHLLQPLQDEVSPGLSRFEKMSSMWAFCRPSINIIIIITTKLCCSSRAFKSHPNTPELFKTPMYYYSTIPLQMFTTVMRWLAFTTMVVLALVRLTDPSQTHGLQCFRNHKKLSPRRGTPSFIY